MDPQNNADVRTSAHLGEGPGLEPQGLESWGLAVIEVTGSGDDELEEFEVSAEIRTDPDSIEDVGIEGGVPVDKQELEEADVEFDDPQVMVTFDDGQDDPDGLGEPTERSRRDRDQTGWNLDAQPSSTATVARVEPLEPEGEV